ncbi:spermatogenesis- and oogenesis-specific basic helix-loop-helix-containing protein 1 [Tenrec ecaudatus]|uniref:spermatogenesis- and oogenesis-specific basic helix-loop-helix-containing protein 1 n=1 Tax=Tenrec ecaudatus TaxID=94439 RepID=UPI003F5A6F71
MASWLPERSAGAPGAPASLRFRGAPPPGTRASLEALDLSQNPPAPGARGPGRRRNVLSERERRKRISNCCEQLRALLPWFACRREDMASVLEMAVLFLRLAHTLVPTPGQHASHKLFQLQTLAPAPARARALELRPHRWQQRALAPPEDRPSSGTSALSLVRPWEPLVAPSGLAEVLGGPSTPPGQQGPCEQGPDGTSSDEGSLESRGGGISAGLDRAELCPVADGGFQELQDMLLEQWGPDLGCAGLALREEPDSLFPELFVCRPWGQGP